MCCLGNCCFSTSKWPADVIWHPRFCHLWPETHGKFSNVIRKTNMQLFALGGIQMMTTFTSLMYKCCGAQWMQPWSDGAVPKALRLLCSDNIYSHRWYVPEWQVDGLVQGCSIFSALAMEILQSCAKPSKYHRSQIQFRPRVDSCKQKKKDSRYI